MKQASLEPDNGKTDTPTVGKKLSGLDPELQAMAKLDRLLRELEPQSRQRVLAWLTDKHLVPAAEDDVDF